MNAPTVDFADNHINPFWINLKWDGLIDSEWSNTGGDKPIEYILEWNDQINTLDEESSQNWIVISTQRVD